MKQLLLLTVLLVLFSSCKQEDDVDFNDDITATFVLDVANMVSIDTPPTFPEGKSIEYESDISLNVSNLWILQYDGITVSAVLTSATYIANVSTTTIEVVLKNASDQTIYFVANTFDRNLYSANNISTLADLATFRIPVDPLKDNERMPMSGFYVGAVADATFTTVVDLHPLFSLVTFNYDVDAALQITNKELEISGITLFNTPTGANVVRTTGLQSTAKDAGTTMDLVFSAINPITGSVKFYIAENIAGVAAITSENDYKLPSDKFGDGSFATAAYIELTGKYTTKEINNAGVETPLVRTAKFKFYLGYRHSSTVPADEFLTYNNYNVNAGYKYTLTTTISTVNETDKRITLTTP